MSRALQRMGTEGGRAIYWVQRPGGVSAPTVEQARVMFTVQGIERRLADRTFEDRLGALGDAKSPIMALGRARHLAHELQAVAEQLTSLARHMSERPASMRSAEAHVAALRAQVRGWIRFRAPADAAPLPDPPAAAQGWTADQLQAQLAPLNATAAAMTDAREVKAHYWRLIRRVPNPAFVNRRASSSDEATEFLFDPVEARRYVAEQWGGAFCQLMSMEA